MTPVLPPAQPRSTLTSTPSNDSAGIDVVSDYFYRGVEGQGGIATALEQLLTRCDRNGDGKVNAEDRGAGAPEQTAWIDLDIEEARRGMLRHMDRVVAAYDANGDRRISEPEFFVAQDALNAMLRRNPEFRNELYVLTAARLSSPDRIATTERLVAAFGEMIDHGLPDALRSAPRQQR